MCSLLGAVICIHLLIIKGYKMHTQILISLSPCMDDLSYKRIAGNFTFMFMSKKKEREIIQSDHSRIKIEIRLNKIDNLLKISYHAQAKNKENLYCSRFDISQINLIQIQNWDFISNC